MKTIYRSGHVIRSTDGTGYADSVSDESIRGHVPHAGPEATEADAFCLAVLAIRAYERATTAS